MAHNAPRPVARLRHADTQGVRRLPDYLGTMARVRLKPRLGEVVVFAFAVPALDDSGGRRGFMMGGPKQGEVLPHLRLVAVHQPVGPCQLRRMALGRGIERRAEDQGRYAMPGAVVVVLRQDGLPKGRHVERRRGDGA